ncbi:hypothetical protein [Caulobacter sp. 3R27C2-B]|uniref:hypothetical protein n=1 Tax=Caulobacter sp. 3R27C2-B TaxID=2502219 RepID=UPI0010F620F7|nr:hypothetical protein [Caulobacter sp. 3R27C2-B]
MGRDVGFDVTVSSLVVEGINRIAARRLRHCAFDLITSRLGGVSHDRLSLTRRYSVQRCAYDVNQRRVQRAVFGQVGFSFQPPEESPQVLILDAAQKGDFALLARDYGFKPRDALSGTVTHSSFSVCSGSHMESRVGGGGQTASADEGEAP